MLKKVAPLIIFIIILSGVFLYINKKDSQEKLTNQDIDSTVEEIDWSEYKTYTLDLTSSTTINQEGIYIISGTIEDGMITVNTKGNVKLELNGVSIKNSNGPAIYVEKAKIVYIELVSNTVNTIEDDGSSELDGAIYSKADLFIEGEGTLKLTANNQDGIVSKDDLVILSGNIDITASDDGIRGKDSVIIKDGDIKITSEGDGIKSSNDENSSKGYIVIDGGNIEINSALDGIQAETNFEINGGNITIKTGSGSSVTSKDNSMWGFNQKSQTTDSKKGIKAGGDITINDGTFNLDTEDDSIHSNSSILIRSGDISASSGDDGIHADDNLTIENGIITISKSYEGLEASQITINDGTISINSSDDGINVSGGDGSSFNRPGANNVNSNSNRKLTINGGTIYVNATGDGLDSNGNIYISGGYITVDGPTSDGDTAIDFDGECVIDGGTLIAVGSSGMLETPSSSSSQNVSIIYLSSSKTEEITIGDISYTPSKQYSSIIISSPSIKTNESYDVVIGGSTYTSYTQSSIVTTVGNTTSRGGTKQGNGRDGRR